MKRILLTAALCLAPLIAQANDDEGIDAMIAQIDGLDLAQMDRAGYLESLQEIWPDLSRGSMLIFSRVSPEVAARVPDLPWDAAYDTAYGCIYDGLVAKDALPELNHLVESSIIVLNGLKDNPGLNLTTMDQYPDFMANIAAPETYMSLLSECGAIRLSSQAMQESGLMEALAAEAAQ